jgi:hypothetical protein
MAALSLRETLARRYGENVRGYRRGYRRTATVEELDRDLAMVEALVRRDALARRVLAGTSAAVFVLSLLASVPVGPPLAGAGCLLGLAIAIVAAFQGGADLPAVELARAVLRSLAVPAGAAVNIALDRGRVDVGPNATSRSGEWALDWLRIEAPLEGGLHGVFVRTVRAMRIFRGRRVGLRFSFAERIRLELVPGSEAYRQGTPPQIAPDPRARLVLPAGAEWESAHADGRAIEVAVRSDRAWSMGGVEGTIDAPRFAAGMLTMVANAARLPSPVRTPPEASRAWLLPLRRNWFAYASLAVAVFFGFGVVETYAAYERAVMSSRPLAAGDVAGLAFTSLGVLVCVGTALAVVAAPLALRWLLPAPR